ncbi:MAG TPA: hypothetical protein VFX98_09175 [Longimicrobiaceae bacterium]|nr:hypothetical protein [Longimicrobiaceae bacterium]
MPRRPPAAARSATEAPHLRLRAYARAAGRHVLLTVPGAGEPVHLLLDGGAAGVVSRGEALHALAADVLRETDGRVDAVVALAGRSAGLARLLEALAAVEVGELWLPWTDDPAHPDAVRSRTRRRRRVRALRRVLLGGADDAPAAEALLHLDKGGTGAEPERVRYLRPGQPPLTLAADVLLWVRGPAGGEEAGEAYEKQFALSVEDSFLAALLAIVPPPPPDQAAPEEGVDPLSEDDAELDEIDADAASLSFPFDAQHQIAFDDARSYVDSQGRKFFQEHYGFDEEGAEPGGWRKIDQDWMGMAAEVALGLGSAPAGGGLALEVQLGKGGPSLVLRPGAAAEAWCPPAAKGAATPLATDYTVAL